MGNRLKVHRFASHWVCAFAFALLPEAVCFGVDTDGDGVDDATDVCCNTPPSALVDAQGRPVGDIDLDCDADLVDLALFIDSFTGPLEPCAVDECSLRTHQCDLHAECHDTPDGYECVCNAGYQGDGFTCADIDECAANPALCGADTCINTEGSYQCGCLAGTSDCDASPGCEVNHVTDIGTCAAPTQLGTHCGDTRTGFGCPETGNWQLHTQRNGRQSAWFRMNMSECSSCCAYLTQRITLLVPPGVDYDLDVTNACGTQVPAWESHSGPGITEQVETDVDDDCAAANNETDLLIRVRYIGGESCQNWTLKIENPG